MAYAELTLDRTVDLIEQGVIATLKPLILKKLHEQIDPILEQAALDAAKNVTAKVESFRDFKEGNVVLNVAFNNKELK